MDAPQPPIRLKARYVFPVEGKPIAGGVVTIDGERIVAVGTQAGASQQIDLGNVAILPGLVNAHTHLELSDVPSPLGRPGMGFVAWIEEVIRFRRETAASPRDPVQLGLEESLRCGTTTLSEIAQPGWNQELFDSAPIDATVFLELLAPTPQRVPTAIEQARAHVRQSSAIWRAGLSPHAPYTVPLELLQDAVAISASQRVPLAMHLAESREEIEFLRAGAGPFREFLGRIDGWRPESAPQGLRVLDHLRLLADADRTLVIHGNYLDEEEIALLAAHRDRMSVVYCPRTHAYFGHDDYPLAKLLAAGVNVALGTDSRASAPDLSVLEEMRLIARRGEIAPSDVLALGTLAGAKALGCERTTGSLVAGKDATLTVVRLPDRDSTDPYELLFDSREPAVAGWRRGRMYSLRSA